jgi:hypothetical protein
MISSAFKSFLQLERENCNHLFASTRRQHPQMDAESFQEFLVQQLDPVVALLDQSGKPVAPFAMAGYQHGLELAAKSCLGKSEFYSQVSGLWRDIIPQSLPLISTNPDYWLSILANLLYRLNTQDVSVSKKWLELMGRSVQKCRSEEELKKTGLILAWISGLACYRQAALDALTEISDELFTAITQMESENRNTIQSSLMANRWLDFSLHTSAKFSKQKRFGSPSLLDGEFTQPPRVEAFNNQFYVTSADRIWLLFFDAFGEMLVPVQDAQLPANKDNELISKIQADIKAARPSGLTDLASFSSCAELNDSLALTSRDSFAVILLNR